MLKGFSQDVNCTPLGFYVVFILVLIYVEDGSTCAVPVLVDVSVCDGRRA